MHPPSSPAIGVARLDTDWAPHGLGAQSVSQPEEHQLEEAAGVSTGGWASVYAETSVEERFAVSALIQEVAW